MAERLPGPNLIEQVLRLGIDTQSRADSDTGENARGRVSPAHDNQVTHMPAGEQEGGGLPRLAGTSTHQTAIHDESSQLSAGARRKPMAFESELVPGQT